MVDYPMLTDEEANRLARLVKGWSRDDSIALTAGKAVVGNLTLGTTERGVEKQLSLWLRLEESYPRLGEGDHHFYLIITSDEGTGDTVNLYYKGELKRQAQCPEYEGSITRLYYDILDQIKQSSPEYVRRKTLTELVRRDLE